MICREVPYIDSSIYLRETKGEKEVLDLSFVPNDVTLCTMYSDV